MMPYANINLTQAYSCHACPPCQGMHVFVVRSLATCKQSQTCLQTPFVADGHGLHASLQLVLSYSNSNLVWFGQTMSSYTV
jgi:hypothetical protein